MKVFLFCFKKYLKVNNEVHMLDINAQLSYQWKHNSRHFPG